MMLSSHPRVSAHPLSQRRRTIARSGLVTLQAAMISLVAVAPAGAQNRSEILPSPPGVTGYMRMGGIFHENFFQVPDSAPRRDVLAGVLEFRAEEKLGEDDGYRAYVRADYYQFQQLGSSPGLLVGGGRVRGAHQFDVSVTAQWHRPRFEYGDELEQANIVGASGTYSLRVLSALELVALGEYGYDTLRINTKLRGASHDAGAAVRFRPLRRLVAELGVLQGARDQNGVEQYVNETSYVQLRTSAIPRTYLSLRYRNRSRDYTTGDSRSSNFGREDRRTQVTAYLDLKLWGSLMWNLSGGLERAESSKAGSSFRSKQFGTTLSVMLPTAVW
jgi:hypothetical protein